MGGYLINDLILLDSKISVDSKGVKSREFFINVAEDYEGMVLCAISRIFFMLATALSKRYLLTRAFFAKIKEK